MQQTKFHGSYEDQLELIFSQLLEHRSHLLMYSLINLDESEIRCNVCRSVVLQGSRELIETMWIGFNNLGSSS